MSVPTTTTRLILQASVAIVLSLMLVNCQTGLSAVAWQDKLNRAVLGGHAFDSAAGLQLNGLPDITADDFTEGKTYGLKLQPVADEAALNGLLTDPEFARHFFDADFTTGNLRFINIIIQQSIYESAGFGLLQYNEHWFWFYQAGVSSKGFLPMFALSQQAGTQYEATLCVSDCGWWGKNARVLIDIARLQLTVQYLTDDYYMQ